MKGPRTKYTVEFEVARVWTDDGFQLTDEQALDMLSEKLAWADMDNELSAKVVKVEEFDEDGNPVT